MWMETLLLRFIPNESPEGAFTWGTLRDLQAAPWLMAPKQKGDTIFDNLQQIFNTENLFSYQLQAQTG